MKSARQRVLLYGNCQSDWLEETLASDLRLASRFEIIHITGNYLTPRTAWLQQPDFLASCAFAVWQTAAGCQPPAFVAALPKTCRQIRYPTLCLKAFWPLHTLDPRNQPEPGFPNGRYPLGDRLLLKLLEDGVPVSDLARRYLETDLNTVVNLERFAKMSFAELHHNDRQSDIFIAPLIESLFRRRRIFVLNTHPTFLLLHHLAHEITVRLLDENIPAAPVEPADADEMLGDQQIPIHPQVAAHFGLTWYQPNLIYEYGQSKLTLEEYVRAYGAYEKLPFGEFPESWRQRMIRALQAGQVTSAMAILRQACRTFSHEPTFALALANCLGRNGRPHEAVRILQRCIGSCPAHSRTGVTLRYEVALLLSQCQREGEARQALQELLSIDPTHQLARRQLFMIDARQIQSPPTRTINQTPAIAS